MTKTKQVLRIKSAPDIIGMIPFILGYRPQRSIVALGLRQHGEKFRIGFTVRSDLPDPSSIRPLAEHVTVRLAYHKFKTAIFVAYADEDDLDYPLGRLFDALARQATLRDIAVHDALLVANGRWRSHLCANPACCPPEGTPLDDSPGPAELSAVTAGLTALPDRQALSDLLRPASEITLAAMEQEVGIAAARAATALRDGDRHNYQEESVALVKQLLDRHRPGRPVRPSHQEAARILVGLIDLTVRDLCMCWAKGRRGEAARALWTELVRLSVPPLGAAPATLLAYVAWQQGDGSFANVALQRALTHDPSYSLARLLGEALDRSLHPRTLGPERVRAALREAGDRC